MLLVKSTQKLPSAFVCRRAKPRMMAMETAIPVAAERKFCTVKPTIWDKMLMDASPA